MVAISIMIAVAFGLFAGAALGFWGGHFLINKIIASARSPQAMNFCILAAQLLAAVPAFLLAFFVGGNFGGALGSAVSMSMVPVGIALGISLCFGALLLAAAALGAVLGWAFGMVASNPTHP